MKISTKGRYALRVMIDLAGHDAGAVISLRDISQRQGITLKYLEQITPLLSRAGLLKSIRGSSGGYRLTRPAAEYTAGEILRAVEGSLVPVACLEDEPNCCTRCNDCKTLPFWQGLAQIIDDYVDGVTLEDLLRGAPFLPESL
ncbi:RrF2 family transcriptional regulator [Oscillospiraceae bacterium LTW-04]|nr:Rrf2 family transcriptional regulator [Oscillospiraceae bacterium MB24-C1]